MMEPVFMVAENLIPVLFRFLLNQVRFCKYPFITGILVRADNIASSLTNCSNAFGVDFSSSLWSGLWVDLVLQLRVAE